jgi:hypothetical protein
MTIIESKDLFGADIVTVVDEENDTAESMTKTEYDRRQAEQSTPIVIDETKTK